MRQQKSAAELVPQKLPAAGLQASFWMSENAPRRGFFEGCVPMNRKARDRAVAQEIAEELTRALGPVRPETLIEHRDIVGEIFGAALDKYGIVTENAAAHVMRCVPRVLAKAELARRRDSATVKAESFD